MDMPYLLTDLQQTPAFVLDQQQIVNNVKVLADLAVTSGCKPLYSIKALPLASVLRWTKEYVQGFSVSSLFEARLASEILGCSGSIHLTTPGIRADEIAELKSLCSHISFNSLSQWQCYTELPSLGTSFGLRVNPNLSFTRDARYDPCRPYSKLGVSIDTLVQQGLPKGVQGLHVHTVFGATDFKPLLQTFKYLQQQLGQAFNALQWLNLGGGYLYGQIADYEPFISFVKHLRAEFGLQVYIEPGNALVGNAGYLVSSVIDTFQSDGKQIAVLDTSVSHLPEVFEYQIRPEIVPFNVGTDHEAILAGSTCLAGDVFGEYQFKQALKIGDRVVFKRVGAYTLIKANRFNGYALPAVYALQGGQLTLLQQDDYADYRKQWLV